jgi:NADH-quinone oxidoreductase subunit N
MSAELALSVRLLLPEWIAVGTLVALFLLDALLPSSRSTKAPLCVILVGCALGILSTLALVPTEQILFFSGSVVSDGVSSFFRIFFFVTCALCAYLAYGTEEIPNDAKSEFSLLLMCVCFGLCLMAIAANLLILYIGLETVSIVSFVMAGLHRDDIRSNEASLKYFVFGAVASAMMIYGFSILYGLTGSLQYQEIAKALSGSAASVDPGISSGGVATGTSFLPLLISILMIYAGLAYKISAFPLHFWTPDVYEGAPTPVTTFFSVGPKAAGFVAAMRLLFEAFSTTSENGWKPLSLASGVSWADGLAVISAATMFVGNLSALGQKNVKRMMAYSSIAHVGYILMGLVAANRFGMSAVLFYLAVYCLMNLGAFWIISWVVDKKGSEGFDAFSGLGWENPLLGVCLAVFLFSLTGIPLFGGFIGKFLLFAAVIQTPGFLWLAVLGVINSVISLYYYANLLKAVWFEKPVTPQTRALGLYHGLGIVGLAIPTIVLGLFFGPLLHIAERWVATFK